MPLSDLPENPAKLPFWASAVLVGGGAVWLALVLGAYWALAMVDPSVNPRAQVAGVLDVQRLVFGPIGVLLLAAILVAGIIFRMKEQRVGHATARSIVDGSAHEQETP